MTDSNLLFAAGLLAMIVALIHSVLDEMLIFNDMRRGRIVPTDGGDRLRERHVRILWASWHLAAVLGCALAAVLLRLADTSALPLRPFLIVVVSAAMLIGASLVLLATKGRHPGWLGMLGVAVLTWLAR